MTRTMYDSVTSADIPAGATMVAGYTDGLYKWSYNDWARHGSAVLVRICAVSIDMSAHVADVENGALSAAQGAEFVVQKLARGEIPALYFSTGRWAEVSAAVRARGVADNRWLYWAAQWDGKPASLPLSSSPSGSYVAHQYAGSATSGGHYDLSAVADYWPGVDPAPGTTPPPPPPPPPVGNPPADSPPPSTSGPPSAPPLDQTRSAWGGLVGWLTQGLPSAIAELLRLLGLLRKTP